MKRSRPLISVCIPSYNGAEFIGETIQSVLNQSLNDFELIISDDHSTDDTVAVVKRFQDARIRLVVNSANLGIGPNWNGVLSQGVGKYVKLLCEDDLLTPDCLERQVEVLEDPKHGGVVLAVCNREVINERNEVLLKSRIAISGGLVSGSRLIRRSVRAGTNLIGEPAVGLFRREAMNKANLCDSTNPFLIDLSLWAEVLKCGDAFVDTKCLASFRVSRRATSTRIGVRQARWFRDFARKQRQDGFHGVSLLDSASGSLLSMPWCLLRNVLVRLRTRNNQLNRLQIPSCSQLGTLEERLSEHKSRAAWDSRQGRHPSWITFS